MEVVEDVCDWKKGPIEEVGDRKKKVRLTLETGKRGSMEAVGEWKNRFGGACC